MSKPRLLYLVTEDWFFCSHFISRAKAAKEAGYDIFVAAREGRHGDEIKRAGFEFLPVNFQRSEVNPIAIFKEVLAVINIYRKVRPDLVHHVALRPIIVGGVSAKICRLKGVVNAPVGMGYVFTSMSPKAKLLKPVVTSLLRLLLKGRDCILENNDDLSELIKRGLLHPHNAILIEGAGVSLSEYGFHLRENMRPKVMLAARMLKEKGIQEFIEAAEIINRKGRGCDFLLVGGCDAGNPGSIPQETIKEWCKKSGVKWVGHSEEMQKTILEADIFCLPSYREGLPKSLLEAGASGCSIITTDVPGCRQIIKNMRTGLVVPPRDSLALANAIETLLETPALRASLAAAMRIEIEEKYSEEIINRSTLVVYERLLS
ncbi:glycosyltransferase family 4 protein [Pseudomonas aeruginosa]|uniref:glycosyltransferase family 4 protein n=1 Tax=Pseudomonas aeruginosa TaxID=287 RepID=UPI000D3B660C|nr:glycosyltransferase family 4 protein [Pseudomonas aeruginosa]PUA08620.1 glycosyltransferase family 1 protein [Pseudomonas aeruginosa]